jgi:hypothetical protein
VHIWGCHGVYAGHIYRCPQSIFLPKLLGLADEEHTRDGLPLRDAPDFRDELLRFLTSAQPLQACRNCLGTAGVLRPHIQVDRKEWPSHQDGPIAALLDEDELCRIESEMHLMKPDHIKTLVAGQTA